MTLPPQPRQIFWIDINDHRPDDELTVLVQEVEEEINLGYHDGDVWRNQHGEPIEVTHWADLPEPAKLTQ